MPGGLRSLYNDVKQDSWLLQTLKQKVTTYSKPFRPTKKWYIVSFSDFVLIIISLIMSRTCINYPWAEGAQDFFYLSVSYHILYTFFIVCLLSWLTPVLVFYY